MAVSMSAAEFEDLVAQALDEIPEEFIEKMDNVVFLVADEPSSDQISEAEDGELLGLYDGFALTDSEFFGEPNRIWIFREPTLAICDSAQEVKEQVYITVMHEVAHHFGIEEEFLWEHGWG